MWSTAFDLGPKLLRWGSFEKVVILCLWVSVVEGGVGIFGFADLGQVLVPRFSVSVVAPKHCGFWYWCLVRFAGFLQFTLCFSIFVTNNGGFSYFSIHCSLQFFYPGFLLDRNSWKPGVFSSRRYFGRNGCQAEYEKLKITLSKRLFLLYHAACDNVLWTLAWNNIGLARFVHEE